MKKLLLSLMMVFGIFTLAACGGESTEPVSEDQALVENARDALLLAADASRITSDINLPTSGRNGTTITWSSSNPSVVSNTGAVTRPEPGSGNAIVTLTATIQLNEASATRAFEVNVVEMPETNLIDIVDALATPVGEVVTIRGVVTHSYESQNRVALQDETGGMFLFGVRSFGLEIGDHVEVLGVRRDFNALRQLDPVESVTVLSKNNALPDSVLVDFDADLISYQNQSIRIEGLLLQENPPRITALSGVNYNLVDEDGNVVIIFRIESEGNLGEAIRNPIVELMNSLIGGESVTIDGALMGWFNAPQITITNVDQLSFERNELTDSQALAADIALYDQILFTAGADIELPEEGLNETVFANWTSSHPELIANDGTFVALPEATTLVTFTAEATRGSETGTLEIQVDALAPISIEDALEVPAGRAVFITGKIVDIVAPNSGFFIYDETGYMYVRDTRFWGANSDEVEIGDSWTFVGVRDTFRGLPQITGLTVSEASTETFADEVNQGFITLQDIKDGNIIPGAKYYIFGTATLNEGRFTDYRIQTGDVFVQLHHNTNNSAIADFEDEEIALEVRPFQWDFSTPFVTYTLTADDIITELTTAQEQELAAVTAASNAKLFDTVRDDLDFATTGLFDNTVSWSSSNTNVVANDGTVTLPAEATTVTITVSVGSFSKAYEVEVAAAPLTVSDAIDQEKGTRMVVQGVVVSIDPHTNGFFIQDEDGTGIYVGNFGSDELKSLVKVGDLVWVSGVRDTFDRFGNIQNQVWTASLVAVVRSNQERYVFEGFTLDQIIADYPESDSKRFIVEDVTIDFYDTRSHVFLTNSDDDLEMQIKFDIRQVAGGWDPEDYPEGTVLTLAFTTQRIDFDNYRVVDVVIITEE